MRRALKIVVLAASLIRVLGEAVCATVGAYQTKSAVHEMEGGNMYCVFPIGTQEGFPLLSFEHGDWGGGEWLRYTYSSLLEGVASSGFVVCAPMMCLTSCRQDQHHHQLNAIVAAKALGLAGDLPISSEAAVGILGHSTGGMTTLKCAYRESVSAHHIGAALTYNGDGPPEDLIANDGVKFEAIDPVLPILMISGTADRTEPHLSTRHNAVAVLEAHQQQPLLVAEIKDESHMDPNDLPLIHPAPLKAMAHIVAFFGYTLRDSPVCSESYKHTLGEELLRQSPSYYSNSLFPPELVTVVF